jgi:hypothetical protein
VWWFTRGSIIAGFAIAALLLGLHGPVVHGQPKDKNAEPSIDELKKEVADLRQLLKFQGTWKRAEDGSVLIIEGEQWKWVLPDKKVAGNGTLRIVEVGKETGKVKLIREGDKDGDAVPMYTRGKDTMFHQGGDGKMNEWKRVPR